MEADDVWLDSLRSSKTFSTLTPRSFTPGQPILVQDNIESTFFIVLSGVATVQRHGDTVAEVGAGSVVGELALLTGIPRTMSVIARTEVIAAQGTQMHFDELLLDDSIRAHLLAVAAQRLATNAEPVPFATENGFHGLLRPLLPNDRDQYVHGVSAMSAESRRRRFFSSSLPSEHLLEYLLAIDYFNHFAWVVVDQDEPSPTGAAIGRFVRDPDRPDTADVAFGVADHHQGKGLATLLLGALAVAAESVGISKFTAEVLSENTPMRRVFTKAKARSHHADRGVVGIELDVADARVLIDPSVAERLQERMAGLAIAADTALRR